MFALGSLLAVLGSVLGGLGRSWGGLGAVLTGLGAVWGGLARLLASAKKHSSNQTIKQTKSPPGTGRVPPTRTSSQAQTRQKNPKEETLY